VIGQGKGEAELRISGTRREKRERRKKGRKEGRREGRKEGRMQASEPRKLNRNGDSDAKCRHFSYSSSEEQQRRHWFSGRAVDAPKLASSETLHIPILTVLSHNTYLLLAVFCQPE
jgi:hypothetical protein